MSRRNSLINNGSALRRAESDETPSSATAATPLSKRTLQGAATAVLLLFLAAGCATGPRVTEVLHNTRLTKVGKFDQGYFVTDRVSGLPLENAELPADQQGEYFDVSWSAHKIETVLFEYRQARLPNQVSVQTLTPVNGRKSWTFGVVGNDFQQGGAVSAWRISLIEGDRVLATKQSSLW